MFLVLKNKIKEKIQTKKKLSSVDKIGFSIRLLQAQDFLIIFLRIIREINTPSCFYRFFFFFFFYYFGKQISQNYVVKWIYYRGKCQQHLNAENINPRIFTLALKLINSFLLFS